MTKVLVIDTETNGLIGATAGEVVAEIGISEIDTNDLTRSSVKPVYSQTIHYDNVNEWSACWWFQNTDATPDDVLNSVVSPKTAVKIVREIVRGRLVTAFNVSFDFDRFLNLRPWNLSRYYAGLPLDIMLTATSVSRHLYDAGAIEDDGLRRDLSNHWAKYPDRWLTAELAYRVFTEDDPAEIHGREKHRALSDSTLEAYILQGVIRAEPRVKFQIADYAAHLTEGVDQ